MLEYDPFSPEAMSDPHRFYPELRAHHPLYRLEAYHGWALSRFEHCFAVLQDPRRFSVVEGPLFVREQVVEPFEDGAIPAADPARSFSTWDPPGHTRIRRAMMPRFSPKAIAELEPGMRVLAQTLLDPLLDRGRFDLVRDLAGPFGLANASRALGLSLEPDEIGPLFAKIQRSTERDPGRPGFTPAGMAVQGEIHQLIQDRVARTRRSRRVDGAAAGDVMTALLRFEMDGRGLGDAELATQLVTLLLGAAETIPKVIAGGLREIGRQPGAWQALGRDRARTSAVFEEMLRHQGVLQHVGRTALEDVDLGDQRIRRGDRLFLLLQSANRDEREFPDGERFDVHREPSRHLALGVGRHHCIGSHLARLEGRVLLEVLLDRVSGFRVVESGLERSASEFQVGHTRLPIEIEAGGRAPS